MAENIDVSVRKPAEITLDTPTRQSNTMEIEPEGIPGPGLPPGGTPGQIIRKSAPESYKTEWADYPTAEDVGALPADTVIPTKTSQLENDSGYLTEAPVTSVNSKTGAVELSAEDVGAYVKPEDGIPASDLKDKYAGSATAGGAAIRTAGMFVGSLDGTSTSTVMTATIPGITELYGGVHIWLTNGVVTSASGVTLNVNNLGAKPIYQSQAAASAISTLFNINYTALLVYNENRVTGGCWDYVYGYNSDTNTIAYQVRTNSTVMKTSDQSRYYRLFFTSADGTHMVPANTAKDNSATSKKTPNTRPINPFGRIIYYSYTTNLSAESDLGASYCWSQYTFALGYSFNTTGAALTLTLKTPVYIKCTPQSDGSAVIDATTPYVQALPTTNDGKIYIFLGIAYSATNVELQLNHPVYYHNGTGIRIWTGGA